MSKWKRHQGDVNDFVIVRIDGLADLTTVTAVTATVRTAGGSAVALSASVLDATARLVRVSLSPWLATAALGCWRLATHITMGAVGPLTWPEDGYDEIEVERPV